MEAFSNVNIVAKLLAKLQEIESSRESATARPPIATGIATTPQGSVTMPQGSALTKQKSTMTPQGSSISPQM